MKIKVLILVLAQAVLFGCAQGENLQAPSAAASPMSDFSIQNAKTNELISRDPVGSAHDAVRGYAFMFGTADYKWPKNLIRWKYNPSGQPRGLSTQTVIRQLIEATNMWERECGVRFFYEGLTNENLSSSCDGETVVGWESYSGTQVGNTKVCYQGYGDDGGFTEFDLGLDNYGSTQVGASNIIAVASHEFGHAMGLGHTDVRYAMMTPFVTAHVLVSDDVQGCRALYGR